MSAATSTSGPTLHRAQYFEMHHISFSYSAAPSHIETQNHVECESGIDLQEILSSYARVAMIRITLWLRPKNRFVVNLCSLWGDRRDGIMLKCGPELYFFDFSISVVNLVVPSSAISTRGAVPRIPIVATGVSTFISPVCAISPAMKVNVPLTRFIRLEFELPFGSYTNSSTSILALREDLNDEPSANVIPSTPSAPV